MLSGRLPFTKKKGEANSRFLERIQRSDFDRRVRSTDEVDAAAAHNSGANAGAAKAVAPSPPPPPPGSVPDSADPTPELDGSGSLSGGRLAGPAQDGGAGAGLSELLVEKVEDPRKRHEPPLPSEEAADFITGLLRFSPKERLGCQASAPPSSYPPANPPLVAYARQALPLPRTPQQTLL